MSLTLFVNSSTSFFSSLISSLWTVVGVVISDTFDLVPCDGVGGFWGFLAATWAQLKPEIDTECLARCCGAAS